MLTPAQIQAVTELQQAVTATDDVAPFNEQTELTLRSTNPRIHHLLAWHGDELAGFAAVDATAQVPSGELAVHPDYRRRGRGSALLKGMRQLAPEVRIWAHGGLDASRGFAQALGLEPMRELLKLQRDAEVRDADPSEAAVAGSPALPAPPTGFTVQQFTPGIDDQAWLALNAVAFADHPEQGSLTQRDLDQRISQPWFRADSFFLLRTEDAAHPGDQLAGSIWLKIANGIPEIYVVAVSPDHQGRGLGGWLTGYGLAQAARLTPGAPVVLYVDGENIPAVRAYRRAGFVTAETHIQYRV